MKDKEHRQKTLTFLKIYYIVNLFNLTHRYQREREALAHPGHQQTTWCRLRGFWVISSWSLLNSKAEHTSKSTSPGSTCVNSAQFSFFLHPLGSITVVGMSIGLRQLSEFNVPKRRGLLHDQIPSGGLLVIHTSMVWSITSNRPNLNNVDFLMSPMWRLIRDKLLHHLHSGVWMEGWWVGLQVLQYNWNSHFHHFDGLLIMHWQSTTQITLQIPQNMLILILKRIQ